MAGGKLPYFKFYAQDFLSSGRVDMMSTEAVGALFFLMCKSWLQPEPGTLPKDEAILAKWSRVSPDAWQEIRSEVLSIWTDMGDHYKQDRLRKEYELIQEEYDKKSASGSKAASVRWGSKDKSQTPTDAAALRSHCGGNADAMRSDAIQIQNQNQNQNQNQKEPKPRLAAVGPCFRIPQNLNTIPFREALEAFLAQRRSSRKPQTPHATDLMLRKLAAYPVAEAIELLNRATIGGWLSPVFKDKQAAPPQPAPIERPPSEGVMYG